MASTIVSPMLSVVIDRLKSLDGVVYKKILREMRIKMANVQAHAELREKKLANDNDKLIECWLAEVQLVAYFADDLLDDFSSNLIKLRNMREFSLLKWVKLQLRFRRLFDKVRDLSGLSSSITFDRVNDADLTPYRRTTSLVYDRVYGREEDVENIVKLLVDRSDDRSDDRSGDGNCSVLAIYGMGGIGKTTVAQLVLDHGSVRWRFDLTAWVCVSQEFDVTRILKEILEIATFESHKIHDMSTLEAVGRRFIEVLRGKRFLIVLDDVWNEDAGKWSMLRRWFSKAAAPGSIVLLTTRNSKVAAIAAAAGGIIGGQYFLGPLSEDSCFSLFSSVAFPGDVMNNSLISMGREVIAKCGGLPLAVVALGRSKSREREWLSILKRDTWRFSELENILCALRLSYDHLTSNLKLCFAFCSVFPKNYLINKAKLIQYWIANGFVISEGSGRTLEDIGEDYFLELLESSFFTDITRDEDGDIEGCRMHDLIHDLAQSVAGTKCSVVESGMSQNISSELRHSSFVRVSGPPTIPEALLKAKNLRTLLVLSDHYYLPANVPSIFPVFKLMRVLDVSHSGLTKLPDSVGYLIHLRYLNLSRTLIKTLPRSICNLISLLTLELSECYNLKKLPENINMLINLRHLSLQSCSSLSYMPHGIGKLRLLQTLSVFILTKTADFGSLRDLGGLNLRGNLEIKNLEHVRYLEEAREAKLYEKSNLYSLELSWGWNSEFSYDVLDILRPSQDLKVLYVKGFNHPMFPSWLCYSNFNLVKLSLVNCNCEKIPPLGQLPYLRDLLIKGLDNVDIIGREFYGDYLLGEFPSLKKLELFDMPNLLEWQTFNHVTSKVAFPSLETLSIKGCTKLINVPMLPELRKLTLSNCNAVLLGSLAHMKSLSSLAIDEFREQEMISPTNLGKLTSIKTLTIYNSNDLISLLDESLQGFSSLEQLAILLCDELKSLPMGLKHLTSLEKLHIKECKELVHIPDIFPYLPSLRDFSVEGCPKLESLPHITPNILPMQT